MDLDLVRPPLSDNEDLLVASCSFPGGPTNYADIEVGKIYGVREGRASLADRPVHKVKVIAKREERKRPKVRYLEGEREGLEEFVRTSQFLAKWGDVKRVLRDEASLEKLRSANAGVINDVVWDAVSAVMFSTGEDVMVPMESPHRIEIPTSETERIEERFQLEPLASSRCAAFVDREGILHLPFEVAESVAKHIAQRVAGGCPSVHPAARRRTVGCRISTWHAPPKCLRGRSSACGESYPDGMDS